MQHSGDMDYYALLGVDRASPPDEITRAYRRLARQYHPDLHPHDPEADRQFKGVNEAYQVLSDPEKRADYDRQFASPPPLQPSASSVETSEHTELPHQEELEGAVADFAAELEAVANQAAEELRSALRDFGVELDTLARNHRGLPGNRAPRPGRRSPPLQNPNRPPWNGRPPRDGRPPYGGKAPGP